MLHLIAITYDEESTAAQAAEELERCADDLVIDPDAIGVIVCERDGSCQLTTSTHRGATAAWSEFWGVILGVVMGETAMTGLDASFREQINRMLRPGVSVLFMVVEGGRARPIVALSRYGGSTLRCAYSPRQHGTPRQAEAALRPPRAIGHAH